jgi:hypothetical protein
MKTITLTEIREHVVTKGGSYKKENFYLNGQYAYTVNGATMTEQQVRECYKLGLL